MKPLKAEDDQARAELVSEYERLAGIALEALRDQPTRGRPDWVRFLQAHEEMSRTAGVIEVLTFGTGNS